MKGNVHSSGYELKTRPWSHPRDSTSLNTEIDCSSGVLAYPAISFGGCKMRFLPSIAVVLHKFPRFCGPLSQSARETKAASHVLQTVWSYKELRNALTKDGWNKSHFQVQKCNPVQFIPLI